MLAEDVNGRLVGVEELTEHESSVMGEGEVPTVPDVRPIVANRDADMTVFIVISEAEVQTEEPDVVIRWRQVGEFLTYCPRDSPSKVIEVEPDGGVLRGETMLGDPPYEKETVREPSDGFETVAAIRARARAPETLLAARELADTQTVPTRPEPPTRVSDVRSLATLLRAKVTETDPDIGEFMGSSGKTEMTGSE